jgi:hypothetical protein
MTVHRIYIYNKKEIMKSVFQSLLILLFSSSISFGQNNFKVIKVNGTILLKAKGISLETGTLFSDKEDLLFKSEDATAAVINSQRGRLIITSNNHDLSTAKSNYLPSMYNISSRGVSVLASSDLSSYFSGRFVVLIKQGIQVDSNIFPMDREHFFFFRYIYDGEEINKKLEYEGSTFYIDKESLFTVDGKPIPNSDNTKIKLFYRRGNESVPINEFDLIFPDMKQLSKETEIILNEMNEKSSEDKIKEVGSYITEFYGKIHHEQLVSWLETRFAIK